MIRLLKLITSEEIVGECTKRGSKIFVKRPCAIMLIQSKSTPDQHSMALIPYAGYTKGHEVQIESKHIVWEAELDEDVLNQYTSLFGSAIQIVTAPVDTATIPNTSTLNIVKN